MKTLRLRSCLAVSVVLFIAACSSSSTTSGSDGGAHPDSGGTRDAGPTRDGGDAGRTKDAGADVVSHDAKKAVDVMTPVDTGRSVDAGADSGRSTDAGPSSDAGTDAPLGAGCPGSVPSGSCTDNQTSCQYPTSWCVCSYGSPPTNTLGWRCTSLAAGCPDPAPAVGATCPEAGLMCDYGHCMGGAELVCQGGAWANGGAGCPG